MLKINTGSASLLKLVEKGFVVLSILFLSNTVLYIFRESKWLSLPQLNNVIKLGVFGVAVVSFLLLIQEPKKLFSVVRQEKLLWILLAIALSSVLWSYAPTATLRQVTSLISSTLFGIYFASRYTLKQQLQILACALGIAATLSLAIILLLPKYGVMGMSGTTQPEHLAHLGAWRGAYSHKNILGYNMLLAGLVFFYCIHRTSWYRWLAWAGLMLSVTLVLGSTSKTALVILLTLIALLLLCKALRWSYGSSFLLFTATILLSVSFVFLIATNLEFILQDMGRDLTLTGRTQLWAALSSVPPEHPWLGYGYGVFWLKPNERTLAVWNMVGGWKAPNGHNGLLDVWLDLGLLGLSTFILSFIMTSVRAIHWLRQGKNAERAFPLAYLIFLFLVNLTESVLLRSNSSFFWFLYVAVSLTTHRSSSQETSSDGHFSLEANANSYKP
ncbi:O-antigen ligase [Leptolyngbya sp. FACHB-261]|uniref:O-antigen ligase family protein n=1 Tax=Leptolyngbya sp. FACHB-261 TaxID=2692806 RepID=UPI0028C388A0|nr:O-antigen ligase [Leptolyngbya sp. FACHB-261]